MRSKSAHSRVTQLDGLRGLAALVVVACHVVSTLPGIGTAVNDDRSADLTTAEAWAVFSPLHVLWNGTPAVHVFFVLSGFVLVLPFTRPGAATSWVQYYAKRFFRLYLPAWASLAVAVALIVLIPRTASPLQSSWADMFVIEPSVGQVLKDGLLLLSASTINTPLWSLKWEVAFSLLLPVYVLIALRWRRFWPVKIGLALLLAVIGAVQDVEWLSYLPIFAIGAVLGAERERIGELTRSWPRVRLVLRGRGGTVPGQRGVDQPRAAGPRRRGRCDGGRGADRPAVRVLGPGQDGSVTRPRRNGWDGCPSAFTWCTFRSSWPPSPCFDPSRCRWRSPSPWPPRWWQPSCSTATWNSPPTGSRRPRGAPWGAGPAARHPGPPRRKPRSAPASRPVRAMAGATSGQR